MREIMRGSCVVLALCSAAWPVRAQEADESVQALEKPAVYLRAPAERLARIGSAVKLGKTRKAKVRRVLEKVDADVRRKIAAANAEIRALLDEEEQAAFDEMRDDTEYSPPASQATRRLVPTGGLESQERRPRGGGGQGGGMGGGRGGGMGGGMGGGQGGGMGGGQGGGRQQRGRCGDGICQQPEKDHGVCPEDCGQ